MVSSSSTPSRTSTSVPKSLSPSFAFTVVSMGGRKVALSFCIRPRPQSSLRAKQGTVLRFLPVSAPSWSAISLNIARATHETHFALFLPHFHVSSYPEFTLANHVSQLTRCLL